jgi:hypothetical protein
MYSIYQITQTQGEFICCFIAFENFYDQNLYTTFISLKIHQKLLVKVDELLITSSIPIGGQSKSGTF